MKLFSTNHATDADRQPVSRLYLFISAILLSFCVACYVERRIFFDPFAINDDVRNQAYWMLQLITPELFSQDLAASYFTQPSLVSLPVKALYWLASQWMSPIRFSQFLPLLLAPLATSLWFQLTARWRNYHFAFWASLIFNCYIWIIANLAGGLPRAFFYPLFFLFLIFLEKRQWYRVGIVCVFQGLIYPSALFLSLGLLLFHQLRHWRENSCFQAIYVAVGGLLTLVIRYAGTFQAGMFGNLLKGNIAEHWPEFYQGGRVPVFFGRYHSASEKSLSGLLQDCLIRIPSTQHLVLLSIIVLVFGMMLLNRKNWLGKQLKTFPSMFWDLGWVSIILYLLASFSLFYLYIPERYLEYSLPLLIVCFIAFVAEQLEFILSRYCFQKQRLIITAGITALSLGIASFIWHDDLIRVSASRRATLSAIQGLPVNSRISASYWSIANDIPTFAERSVLINREVNIPFHILYYKQMKARFQDWLTAYYTADFLVLQHFIQKYQIDFLVINQNDFSSKKILHLHSVYRGILPDKFSNLIYQRAIQNDFLLNRLNPKCLYFSAGPYDIVNTTQFLRTDCFLPRPRP